MWARYVLEFRDGVEHVFFSSRGPATAVSTPAKRHVSVGRRLHNKKRRTAWRARAAQRADPSDAEAPPPDPTVNSVPVTHVTTVARATLESPATLTRDTLPHEPRDVQSRAIDATTAACTIPEYTATLTRDAPPSEQRAPQPILPLRKATSSTTPPLTRAAKKRKVTSPIHQTDGVDDIADEESDDDSPCTESDASSSEDSETEEDSLLTSTYAEVTAGSAHNDKPITRILCHLCRKETHLSCLDKCMYCYHGITVQKKK